MKKYALLYMGKAAQLFETDGDIKTMFHPDMHWIECSAEVQEGWQFDGRQFVPEGVPVVTLEELKAAVASERFRREGVGIFVDGLQIETTRDSQALIASTGLSAVLDPDYRCNFKTVTGFVEIGAAQIIEIAKAVRAHVQACFDRELTLLRAIESGQYQAEMLFEGWPDEKSEILQSD
ncbi:DUF4376 domain-containing protein [Pseudomonas sp. AO-1]|uniref:DUF4376 domain-containing protein n=1 Tax=Pseudomonas sp. AO-1 TaxID=2855434 RepID=UPI001C77885C|nr:DUF4376 domain-containing protein [Pseudomonas sp. AO-1]QXZ14045.1 DUF4376 domain-containing protein [Pseudomonas sp. AO-1]